MTPTTRRVRRVARGLGVPRRALWDSPHRCPLGNLPSCTHRPSTQAHSALVAEFPGLSKQQTTTVLLRSNNGVDVTRQMQARAACASLTAFARPFIAQGFLTPQSGASFFTYNDSVRTQSRSPRASDALQGLSTDADQLLSNNLTAMFVKYESTEGYVTSARCVLPPCLFLIHSEFCLASGLVLQIPRLPGPAPLRFQRRNGPNRTFCIRHRQPCRVRGQRDFDHARHWHVGRHHGDRFFPGARGGFKEPATHCGRLHLPVGRLRRRVPPHLAARQAHLHPQRAWIFRTPLFWINLTLPFTFAVHNQPCDLYPRFPVAGLLSLPHLPAAERAAGRSVDARRGGGCPPIRGSHNHRIRLHSGIVLPRPRHFPCVQCVWDGMLNLRRTFRSTSD